MLGTGAYARAPADSNSTAKQQSSGNVQAGDTAVTSDALVSVASDAMQPSSTQPRQAPLWPVRLVLAYLQHLRDHGLDEWRWQELRQFRERDMMCGP